MSRIRLMALAAVVAAGAVSFPGAPGHRRAASRPGLQHVTCPAPTVTVRTATQLQSALDRAVPGSVIRVLGGVYAGRFVALHSGTSHRPIWLCGTRASIIDAASAGALRRVVPTSVRAEPYGLHLVHASWWNIVGLGIRHGQKGVVLDASSHDLLDGLSVYDIGDEGIHLRDFSSADIIEGCTIRHTGLETAKYGEGIYVGSAVSNWGRYSGGLPDRSDGNVIRYNNIAFTTAENVDIKEGTAGGTIDFNHFDGRGMVPGAAHSWVNVKGNGYHVDGNTGQTSLGDGFSTYQVVPGDGRGNEFSSNHIGPGVTKYGFALTPGNTLACNNTGAGRKGRANVTCTPVRSTERVVVPWQRAG